MGRMLKNKNIGLFCKKALQKWRIFCKETYIFKHLTKHSHHIVVELTAHEMVSFNILLIACVIMVHCGVLQIMSMWVGGELTAHDMVSFNFLTIEHSDVWRFYLCLYSVEFTAHDVVSVCIIIIMHSAVLQFYLGLYSVEFTAHEVMFIIIIRIVHSDVLRSCLCLYSVEFTTHEVCLWSLFLWSILMYCGDIYVCIPSSLLHMRLCLSSFLS